MFQDAFSVGVRYHAFENSAAISGVERWSGGVAYGF
jgi:hypothetical protein